MLWAWNPLEARVWVGDAVAIPVWNSMYDAVFDCKMIHHIPEWRHALAEVHRHSELVPLGRRGGTPIQYRGPGP